MDEEKKQMEEGQEGEAMPNPQVPAEGGEEAAA